MKTRPLSLLYSYAGRHTESSGDGGQYRDDDVEDFAPKFFFHGVDL